MTLKSTPWGKPQHVDTIAPGIDFYSTANHGGYHLSRDRMAQVPEYMCNTFAGGPWFEEDCDWAIVALTFESDFRCYYNDNERSNFVMKAAMETMEHFRPQHFARFMSDKGFKSCKN